MKKLCVLLLVLAMLAGNCALAFTGAGYPAWDGVELPDNRMGANFGGERLMLDFDPSAEFSQVESGILQACFFASDASQSHYLELDLLLPADVAAGEVFSATQASAMTNLASISLFEVSPTGEESYFSAIEAGGMRPEGSSLEITIENVQNDAGSITVSGRIHALLCHMKGSMPSGETLEIQDGNFHFTLPIAAASAAPALPGGGNASPFAPPSSTPVKPAFTLPPDAVEV